MAKIPKSEKEPEGFVQAFLILLLVAAALWGALVGHRDRMEVCDGNQVNQAKCVGKVSVGIVNE